MLGSTLWRETRVSFCSPKARESRDEMPRDSRPADSWQHSDTTYCMLFVVHVWSCMPSRFWMLHSRGRNGSLLYLEFQSALRTWTCGDHVGLQLRQTSKPSREADSVLVAERGRAHGFKAFHLYSYTFCEESTVIAYVTFGA